ncbi:MAG: hypothetical protein Ta2B_18510 [Termitinemataceae bacterium]|nr:MAG: hypothetical protein Ta2B_18510 [Termitinemataceae bacterium]
MSLGFRIAIIVCFVFLLSSCNKQKNPKEKPIPEFINISSFNIQIFGVSKMSKPEVVTILTDIVSKSDLTAVQEVRSASIDPVENFMSLLPANYAYVIGSREGRSSSKEQYWVIYDTDKLTVIGSATWPDTDDIYERNPFGVYFKTPGKFDFVLIDNHISPSDAENEISALPEVINYYKNLWNEADVLIVGDFNADGKYYDESFLTSIFKDSEYKIIIDNENDTTVAESSNTYDRFIITSSAIEDYNNSYGIIRFDEIYDFSKLTIEPKHVSDHYPIWAQFAVNRDSD